MPERNTELLEKTMAYILDHPERHNQGVWLEASTCGTAACFAGWACLLGLSTSSIPLQAWDLWARECAIRVEAKHLLGLSTAECVVLFDSCNTREDLQIMVKKLINGESITDA